MNAAQSVGATFASSAPPPSALFLVSDSYPLGGPQPDHFDVSCDGGATVTSPAAVNPDGASYLHFNLGALAAGPHTCVVTAADASNLQSAGVSVSFTL
jgi:hypothetical protein